MNKMYAVIRLADGNTFVSSSYAKTVKTDSLVLTGIPGIAMLNESSVYIQNVGNKEYCNKVTKRINDILDYLEKGMKW